MLLSHKTTIRLSDDYANIIGHMCYAAYKLWNVCNYERRNYKELKLEQYPDWYYQKSHHKDDMWYKQLPSQTAQEVCKVLDQAWKSFYALKKSGGIENPKPPRFKQDNIEITYMQNGIVHEKGSDTVRLSLPKKLMKHMEKKYNIRADFLFLKNKIFQNMDVIKQIHIYPPENGECKIIVVYDVESPELLEDNGRYFAIDLGLHNLMTCVDTANQKSFIVGRKYLSLCRKYDKEIARVQSQWYAQQSAKGVKHPKTSKHIQALYLKKSNCIHDYLHKVTRFIAEYCKQNDIHTVVIGDITGIRKEKDFGAKTNQKLHGWPYRKIYLLLEYKLAAYGIRLVKQKESYSSQCSPDSPAVNKANARKSNRKMRGLYVKGEVIWNADGVGAYNILRLYVGADKISMPLHVLSHPEIIKVAA